jgi:hypothetical protein
MSILYSLFSTIFSKDIAASNEKSAKLAVEKYKEEQKGLKKIFKNFEFTEMIGKPIIWLPNEWDNPVIGFVVDLTSVSASEQPAMLVHDYVRNESIVVMSGYHAYTQQTFDALMKLDPFEYCSIHYKKGSNFKPFKKEITQTRNSPDEIVELLKNNGFYEKVTEFEKTL